MDDNQIEIFNNRIKNIINEIEIHINNTNEKLFDYDNTISGNDNKIFLKKDKISKIQNKIKEYNEKIILIENKKENLDNERKIYEEMVLQLNVQINDLKERIDQQQSPAAMVFDSFNQLFNPYSSNESDALIELTVTLNDYIKKCAVHEVTIDRKVGEILKLDGQQSSLEIKISNLNKQINKTSQKILEIVYLNKQYEDDILSNKELILKFETFKSKVEHILLNFNDNTGINKITPEDVAEQLNELYHNYQLSI